MFSLIALIGIAVYLAVLVFRGFSYEQDEHGFSYETVRGMFAALLVLAVCGVLYRSWVLWG